MSGSSISRKQPVEPDVGEASLERLADGDRRQRLEAGPGRRRQLRRRRQDLVEVLGDDVGDRLAAQRGVEDVGRDLRVERDRRRRPRSRSSANRATSTGFTSWPTSGTREPLEQAPQGVRRLRTLRRHDPAVRRRRRPGPAACRGAAAGRRRRATTPTAGWATSHGSRPADPVGAADLDPAGIDDRGRERGRQVLRRERPVRGVRRPWRLRRGPTAPRPAADGVEVEPELQLAALRPSRRARPDPSPRAGPATRAAGT